MGKSDDGGAEGEVGLEVEYNFLVSLYALSQVEIKNMQTPRERNVSLEAPLKASLKTARLVKMPPKNTSPKVTDRKTSPSPVSEKRSIKTSELESQLTYLHDELKKAKEQLNQSESSKKRAHQEAELTKRQLAATSDKLEESRKQLIELSACEDGRILELRKLSHDRDRAWESELEALQKQHTTDSSALAFANNEISKLKLELKESLFVIEKLNSKESVRSEEHEATDVEIFKKNDEIHKDFEKIKVELNCARSEVSRLKTALDLADKRYQEEYIQSTFQIRSAYELCERTKTESSNKETELESKLKKAKEEIEALEANKSNIKNDEKNQNNEVESDLKTERKKLEYLNVCLLEKDAEMQLLAEENKILKMEIKKREKESNRASNEEDLEREAEMRRLKIQSDQWRKAAEVATAMLSNENDDSNYHNIGGKIGLPFPEDVEEEFAKKKNGTVLKKIGVLLKKGQK